MEVPRKKLVAALTIAQIAVTDREMIEQSNCFVFTGDEIVAFDGELLCRVPYPVAIKGAVPASDFLAILGRFPDENIDIATKGGEIIIKGARRTAGMAYAKDVALPLGEVPKPEKGSWQKLPPETLQTIVQAARSCGRDLSAPLTTVVHVTPKLIEGCDNFRLYRFDGKTGLAVEEVLLPAAGMLTVAALEPDRMTIAGGWAHFRNDVGCRVSLRTLAGKYHMGLDELFKLEQPETVVLPKNLADIVARAAVMDEGVGPSLRVELKPGELVVTSRKDTGWFRERKRVDYQGRALDFMVNPKFLVEVFARARKVKVDGRRLLLTDGPVRFVVALGNQAQPQA